MDGKKMERMRELIEILNNAGRAYYQEARELMSNREYDALYDELASLEGELGLTLSNSPTVNVGHEVLSELPKERHKSPMLSLDKTKSIKDVEAFIGNQRAVMSWKLDGLTIVLTYRGGRFEKAVTRGNGEVGEVVTGNARRFQNLPLNIPYRGELILRGEAVIGYRDFQKINREIPDTQARYKNPRNLCSGSVRQLNSEITAGRNVRFYAFSLVEAAGEDFKNSRACQLAWLENQGFETVEHEEITAGEAAAKIKEFSGRMVKNDLPSDGLVFMYDDIEHGQSLGQTSKFPRDSYAFKWADEARETKLIKIEWSASRTGLINPIAVFEPVELEGTTVARASVHNLSIMEELSLGAGDTVKVYKANMIIPQIAENLTKSGTEKPPVCCPVCGGKTEIRKENSTKLLYCGNPLCQAKQVKAFALLASRDALNIEGLSEATLEKFIARGFIHEYADMFRLERFREEIVSMEGFGERSYLRLAESVEKARTASLFRALYGLGIPNVGLAGAKIICRTVKKSPLELMDAGEEELSEAFGVGEVIARAYVEYFKDMEHRRAFTNLLKEIIISKESETQEADLAGLSFVITGGLEHFANRSELKEFIESRGGRVTGSVSPKTSYLIGNDKDSGSSKNRKARELNIKIISEEEFLKMLKA